MAIELRTFASGDTDYIAKMNANVSAIKAAIDALQLQAGAAGAGTALSAGMFMNAVFNNADGLIGPGSYFPTQAATTVSVAPGTMYLAELQTVVSWFDAVTLNFVGQTAGTKYIVVDGGGQAVLRDTQESGAAYSVVWSGSAFIGEPVRIAPCFYDTEEATASRISTSAGEELSPPEDVSYPTLDARLEAAELQLGAGAGGGIRKVGVSLDGSGAPLTTGIKGQVQLDFGGTIIGWSIVADQVGAITVEVDKKASSPPPAAPAIPNTTTDKISASAPIQITSAQSAAGGESEVASWNTVIDQWDVIQFNVAAVTTITRATLYIRIQ